MDFLKSLIAESIKDGVEDEKCVVEQYRTSAEQKDAFVQHLTSCSKDSVPIEWIIDIADETNGWFCGTAYHYDDSRRMLHVMVPNKENPTFDGQVSIDRRTVHLIECVDGKSDALFNKIVRDSVTTIKWTVQWFEESDVGQESSAGDEPVGTWNHSTARYYITMTNELLVEEPERFVLITADLNLELLKCHKGKGIDDFVRLINDGVVLSSDQAAAVARAAQTPTGTPQHAASSLSIFLSPYINTDPAHSTTQRAASNTTDGVNSSVARTGLAPADKMADVSIDLHDCAEETQEDIDRREREAQELGDMYWLSADN